MFAAHGIRTFFYNGAAIPQDTAHKVSLIGERLGYPITAIGIPKTVDNDLPFTDSLPRLRPGGEVRGHFHPGGGLGRGLDGRDLHQGPSSWK